MTAWLRVRLVLDRLLAALLVAVTAPVMGLAGVLIRRHDGGPALIQVGRTGRGGTSFGMWKLRSMRSVTATGLATGPALTSKDDARITPIGRTLRAGHLDELPQLFNVVRGQMALLGPRPEAPEFVDPDDPRWQEVLSVPPGMAGPTQVIVNDWERELIAEEPEGAVYREKVLPVKLAIDRWYLRSSSPVTDLLVFVTLAARFLPGGGAPWLARRIDREVPEARSVVEWNERRSATDSAVRWPTEPSVTARG